MAITLDTTLSGQYSNSYIDSDYADDYWTSHYNQVKAAQWLGLTDDQKDSLLVQACRVMESIRCTVLVPLQGNYNLLYDMHTREVLDINLTQLPVKYYYFQRLQFPRNLDRDDISGVTYIPEPIMMAQCEQAVYTLNFDDTAIATRIQGVTDDMARVGSLHTHQTFVSGGSAIAPMAWEFLKPYSMKSATSMRRA